MRIVNGRIRDGEGRNLILRGVNLGGGSKNPFGPQGWGLRPESLKNPREASFIGRPFPLDEAENHFERLSRAGLTFLRLVVTWEALEHAGPGQYDEAFLAYLRKILLIAGGKNISMFIDPHQDVWSRWTGGDGAPAWTMERLGIDLEKLDTTGAALTRQRYGEFHKRRYPPMSWPGNYNRYAASTMFSLFFGGKTYAPGLTIDGENVQDWLQNRYIAAFRHCYRRLKNCISLAGWGVMNEPHNGFIGYKNLTRTERPVMPVGPRPSPWDAIRAASGFMVKVPVYNEIGMHPRRELFNPGSHTLFKEGYCCPWKQAGVWTDEGGDAVLLRADHFALFDGRQTNFMEDFHKPFTLRFIEAMKETEEHTFFFIEGTPSGSLASAHPVWNKDDPPNTVNAFHWYDGFSLFARKFRSWFTINTENARLILGKKNVQTYFTENLAKGVRWTREHMNNMPCLLGEFGLAFDINNRRAFTNGDYTQHEKALTMYYDAVDANLLHSTIWNYTADNTRAVGDGWNNEDLSIFSEEKERAIAGWKRPYPMAAAGELLAFKWDRQQGIFRCRYRADGNITAPTIIYLPTEWFGQGTKVTAPLRLEHRHEEQRLLVFNDGFTGEVEIQAAMGS